MIKKILAGVALVLALVTPVHAQVSSPGSPVTSGTANTLPKYLTPGSLGSSLLTDNGTKLSYPGAGGIEAPFYTTTGSPSMSILPGGLNAAADGGSTDAYAISFTPALPSYQTNACFHFKANTANTGAATLNINSLGAKTIKKQVGGITTDLDNNDIRAGAIIGVCYDGTNFQMQTLLGNAGASGASVVNSQNNLAPVTCGAAEQTAFTYSMPGGTVTTNKSLRIEAVVTYSGGVTANINPRIYIGTVASMGGGTLSNPPWGFSMRFLPHTNTAGTLYGTWSNGGNSNTAANMQATATTGDITGSLDVKLTLQCTNTDGTFTPLSWRVIVD